MGAFHSFCVLYTQYLLCPNLQTNTLNFMGKRASKPEYIFDTTLIDCELKKLQPLRFVMVYKTPLEPVWDFVVSKYHYLGYNMMIGPRVKYLIFSGTTLLAAISFNQAAYKVGLRDCFIGWREEQRKQQLTLILNNNRFLILPWDNVSYCTSPSISLNQQTHKM